MIIPRISRLNHARATPPSRRRTAHQAHARPARRKRWSEERVKTALRALAAKGEAVNPTRAGLPLYYAARAYFGTFADACEAAGLEMGRERKWSEDAIRAALRRLARTGPITSKRVPYPLRKACRRYAGSLAKACEAAGVDVDPRLLRQRRRWNRRLVLEELRKEARRRGAPARNPSLAAAAWKYFGSIDKARRAAGLAAPRRSARKAS